MQYALPKNVLFALIFFFITGCGNFQSPGSPEKIKEQGIITPIIAIDTVGQPDPANEDAGIIVPEDSLVAFTDSCVKSPLAKSLWAEEIHDNYVYLCAVKLGLSTSRASAMRDAAHMPDVFQSGLDNLYNQQWSHAYMIVKMFWGPQWVWGDADDDFHDNIDSSDNGIEGPEGYNGKWAGYYYRAGKQSLGDWYTGYACHYIADVSFVLHVTVPDYDMAVHHFDYETWISNNWDKGHCFATTANQVPVSSYYTISDLRSGIENAALKATASYSANGRLAWENYKASGFPTAAGSGSLLAAQYTRKMVEEATKWTGGAIKYSLIKYKQW
jgi:hypothetical protein